MCNNFDKNWCNLRKDIIGASYKIKHSQIRKAKIWLKIGVIRSKKTDEILKERGQNIPKRKA